MDIKCIFRGQDACSRNNVNATIVFLSSVCLKDRVTQKIHYCVLKVCAGFTVSKNDLYFHDVCPPKQSTHFGSEGVPTTTREDYHSQEQNSRECISPLDNASISIWTLTTVFLLPKSIFLNFPLNVQNQEGESSQNAKRRMAPAKGQRHSPPLHATHIYSTITSATLILIRDILNRSSHKIGSY